MGVANLISASLPCRNPLHAAQHGCKFPECPGCKHSCGFGIYYGPRDLFYLWRSQIIAPNSGPFDSVVPSIEKQGLANPAEAAPWHQSN